MGYLRLGRSRALLTAFLLFAMLVRAFPGVDVRISQIFFDGESFWRHGWQTVLTASLGYVIAASLVAVSAIYLSNKLFKHSLAGIEGRRLVYVFLVAAVGAGLIVNIGLKDQVGRARPRNTVEFGGSQKFTPAFVLSEECSRNCSFSSGDAAGAFSLIAVARALSKRRRYLVAAIAFGVVVSIGRIASGAHFFSDTVMSFFVMLIVADVFWYGLVSRHERAERNFVRGMVPSSRTISPGELRLP